jgi:RNA polymerase sigma factor (sigma-70 family)
MNFDSFEKKLERFVSNNKELIEEYEDKTGDNFEEYVHDLYHLYEKMIKVQSNTDMNILLQNLLYDAISNNNNILDSFDSAISRASVSDDSVNTLQQYFKELGKVYDKHNNDYDIVYCAENREKLIEMNLKTVISIAKGYQGLGLTLEELISAGNLGLVTSFDKYDPNKAKLKDDMLSTLEELPEDATNSTILQHIQKYMTYGDVRKKFIKTFGITKGYDEPEDEEDDILETNYKQDTRVIEWKPFNKSEVIQWIKKNVKNATFNSVAFMWIRAFILIEIDNNSRLVKKPKSEIYNDKIKYGSYKKEVTLDIDAPISDGGGACFGDILQLESDEPTSIEVSEAYDTFKQGLDKLLDGVKPRDRSVFLKKFGIGLPRPMLPKEIAEQENLSIARISQIFQSVIEQMQRNTTKYNINPNILFEAAQYLS